MTVSNRKLDRKRRRKRQNHDPELLHAQKRMIERIGRPLSALQEAVSKGQFSFLLRQTASRSVCVAPIDGVAVYFVLNRRTQEIVTVLPSAAAAATVGGEIPQDARMVGFVAGEQGQGDADENNNT